MEPVIFTGDIVEYNFCLFKGALAVNPTTLAAYKMGAVIDTGAYGNFLKPSIITALGLEQAGEAQQMHPIEGLSRMMPFYYADIVIQGRVFEKIKIEVLYQEEFPASLILGGSFLEGGYFVYDWPNKTISLQFPNLEIPVWPYTI